MKINTRIKMPLRALHTFLLLAAVVPSTAFVRHEPLPSHRCHRPLAARRIVTARIVTPSSAATLAATISVAAAAAPAGAATMASTVALPSLPPLSVSSPPPPLHRPYLPATAPTAPPPHI